MPKLKVAMIAKKLPELELMQKQLEGIDYDFDVYICESDGETMEAVKGVDLIINQGVKMPKSVIDEIDSAKAIVSFAHGFDHIDHEAATNNSVMVVNTAGFCTEEVSNHAIMLILACAKKLITLDKMTRLGSWGAETNAVMNNMVPVTDQTLGLIGLGNIGRAVARKAQALGLSVIAYDPFVAPWLAREYRVQLSSDMYEIAGQSDFISMHIPLNNQTRKMVGKRFFDSMKSSAYFINTCRGGTVDETELIASLKASKFAGAGIDVFETEPTSRDNPLFKMDNVIVTPHTAGTSNRAKIAAQVQVGQEAARLLNGTWPMSLVNPEVRSQIDSRSPATI